METTKRIGIWIRVSTDFQVKDESPEHHEKRARYYAEAKGWNIVEVYRLDAVSGKSVLGLPETKRMLQDIKSGHIHGLIFSKLARLARNTKELLELADTFKDAGADLISLQEAIDTSTPAGRLFYTMIAAMAQWEREEISARVAASVPVRAQLGKPLGGQASFGYRWEGKDLVIDEREAPIRKLIYEVFSEYKRKKTTADKLNQMGYRTRNGSKFTDTTIHRLLRDSTAKGQRIANYTKSTGDGKKWVIKPKEDWIVLPCPAIVSEALWNECNAILNEQERKRKPGPRAVHLLSGFVHCACGKKMYVYHPKNPTYRCSTCRHNISVTDLDEVFHAQLKSFLLTETDRDEYLHQSESVIADKKTLLQTIQTDAEKVRKRMDDLLTLRLDGEIGKENFAERYKPLEVRYNQLQEQIPELEAEIDFLHIQQLSSDTVLQDAKDLYDRWPSLAFEEKRSIAEVITEKITIGKTDISLSLAYTPSINRGKRQHNLRDSWKR